MVNLFDYENCSKVKIVLTDGRTYTGYVDAVIPSEDSGFGENCIDITRLTGSDESNTFPQSAIADIEVADSRRSTVIPE